MYAKFKCDPIFKRRVFVDIVCPVSTRPDIFHRIKYVNQIFDLSKEIAIESDKLVSSQLDTIYDDANRDEDNSIKIVNPIDFIKILGDDENDNE